MPSNDPSALPSLVTIGCVNFDADPDDLSVTLAAILDWTRKAARQGCDLVVFPELALGRWGRCDDCAAAHAPCPHHLAEAEVVPGPSTLAIAALAAELDIHVIVGMSETDPDDPTVLYNAAAVIAPDGILGTYRKVHLGIPLETDRFTPGSELPVFDTRLGGSGVQICYDFYNNPEMSRILAQKGARILVNPTGRGDLPRGRDNLRRMTLVRAEENLAVAASSNRCGDRHGSAWAGGSVIACPAYPGFGEVIAVADESEQLIVGTVNFDKIAAWNDVLPWRDWRMGGQAGATRLVADEFAALADKAES